MPIYRMLIFLWIILAGFLFPFAAAAAEGNDSADFISDQSLRYDQWYALDREHMREISKMRMQNNAAYQERLIVEWDRITQELAAALQKGYVDEESLFTVYSADYSGKIHVLGLAKYYREKLLEDLLNRNALLRDYPVLLAGGCPAGIPPMDGGGFSLAGISPSMQITDVLEAVKSVDLPRGSFKGITVYMLPFKIDGYKAFTISQKLPGQEEAIYLSAFDKQAPLRAVIAHELGHCMDLQYLAAAPDRIYFWQFCKTGSEKIAADEMAYENFAECFRMVYGTPAARTEMEFLGNCFNPAGNQQLANNFRQWLDKKVSVKNNYYDYSKMNIAFGDAQGKRSQVLAGSRPEQINTVVSTSPEISFVSPLILSAEQGFSPAGVLYQPGKVTSLPAVLRQGTVQINAILPGEGSYYLLIGQADEDQGITNYFKIKIIYIKEQNKL